jgi:hypothetical protein
MSEPRVKGSLIRGAVMAVQKRLQSGEIETAELETHLSAEAIALLDEKISVASWYPIRLMSELAELDWLVGADRDPEYQRRAGRRTAQHFAKAGLYQQVEYANRHQRAASREDVLRQSRLVSTLTSTLYDFITSRAEIVDGDRLQIVFENANSFPDSIRYSTEGFLNEMTNRKNRLWQSERPTPDRVVFTLEIRPRD